MSEASKRQEMVPAMSAEGAALSRKRLSGIDAARGLALIGLTAIHYLPALVAGVGLGSITTSRKLLAKHTPGGYCRK